MKKSDVFRAWGKILTGRYPFLSLEITRECPLRCPGCYAYEPGHLNDTGQTLRTVADHKGQDLIDKVLELVDRYRPLHLSIVGGEPLVRFRELNVLLPRLSRLGLSVQLVTSAVREIPKEWRNIENLYIVVSVDGLQAEHDRRRKPATYERILRNIAGHSITVHCTITSQMTERDGYFEEFLSFWSNVEEVRKVWFSLFTPQVGALDPEILDRNTRKSAIDTLEGLKSRFSKLDLPRPVISGFRKPPRTPKECIFSRTTLNLTANLEDRISPCQFGGTPDCSNCGCMASAGLAAVGEYRLLGLTKLRSIYNISDRIGRNVSEYLH